MNQQRVLVLGASGHIGQNLIPALIAQGHQVTAGARRVDWMMSQGWQNTRCVFVDLHDPKTLRDVIRNTDIVYYLVHSMGDAHNLIEQERQAALNVVDALEESDVKQIIFLSALQHKDQPYSPHLVARKLTGEVLRTSSIPVTEIRTSMIVGPGSAAFEIMRDMVYNLPILTPPRWVRSKSSPIALKNLIYYLTEIIHHPTHQHRIFDAGGPEYISYQTLFERFINISGKKRLLIPLPIPASIISAGFISLITSVPTSIAKELIQGLKYDLPAKDASLRKLIPQKLISFDDAVRETLADEEAALDDQDWGYSPEVRNRWKPGYGYYPKNAGCTVSTPASAAALWHVVQQIGGEQGYFYGNALWKTRALLDDLVGNKVTYGRPQRETLALGDMIDGWRVIKVRA